MFNTAGGTEVNRNLEFATGGRGGGNTLHNCVGGRVHGDLEDVGGGGGDQVGHAAHVTVVRLYQRGRVEAEDVETLLYAHARFPTCLQNPNPESARVEAKLFEHPAVCVSPTLFPPCLQNPNPKSARVETILFEHPAECLRPRAISPVPAKPPHVDPTCIHPQRSIAQLSQMHCAI